MFRFFRPHRTPQERHDKEKQIEKAKEEHKEIVQEAVNVTEAFQSLIRGGPRLDVQLQRIKRAMRDRER